LLLKNNSRSALLVKGIMLALIMILSFSALTFVVGNLHSVLFHPGVVAAGDSTNDPKATGNWQQDQYDSIIVSESQAFGLNPFIVKGQIALESQFDTWAGSEVINSACDYTYDEGLMQVNPHCQQTGSADLFDPATNIYYGTAELASAYWQLGNIDLALQAYNIGVPNVLSGGRNWAYSSAVESYAQEFENEHCVVYGCWATSSTTTSTTDSTSESYSQENESSSSLSTVTETTAPLSTQTALSPQSPQSNVTVNSIQRHSQISDDYRDLRLLGVPSLSMISFSNSSSLTMTNLSSSERTQTTEHLPNEIDLQNVQVVQNGSTTVVPPSNFAERATLVLYFHSYFIFVSGFHDS
jgi:hypothetical protein